MQLPRPEQLLVQRGAAHAAPSHSGWHSHLPSTHVPWLGPLHRLGQCRSRSHEAPSKPSEQWHVPCPG